MYIIYTDIYRYRYIYMYMYVCTHTGMNAYVHACVRTRSTCARTCMDAHIHWCDQHTQWRLLKVGRARSRTSKNNHNQTLYAREHQRGT